MKSADNLSDKLQRRYPRRSIERRVGVLCGGQYFLCEGVEIGEGGMSILSEFALSNGQMLVVSFQLPFGSFISLQAQVVSAQKKVGDVLITHGLSFGLLDFKVKRQIRQYVSGRKDFVIQQKTINFK